MAEENTQWYDGLGIEAENIGVIQNKGWTDANSIIKSYRELEKASGRDKNDFIAIPKAGEGETPDYSAVYARLGRPETAEGYELTDSDFAKAARDVLFKAGITQSQAKELETWINQYAADTQKAADEARAAEVAQFNKLGLENLKKEWGADFDKNTALAKTVVKAMGLTDDQIDAMGDVVGPDVVSKIFLAAAQRTDSESPLTGYRSAGGETAEMAALKISEMNSDPEIVKKLAQGDEKVAAEYIRLAAITAQKK